MRGARVWLIGAAFVGLGWMVTETNSSRAGDEKAARDGILKIAKAFQKGDTAGATKLAEDLAKKLDPDEGLHDVMHLFKPRSKKGLGVGAKAGTVIPDGIELKLLAIARDAPSPVTLKREGEALEEMAYVVAAIAEVAQIKPPKFGGKKNKKDWATWTKDMRDGALKLAAATKARGGAEIKAAAAKLNDSCANCHPIFKPGI